MSIIIPSSSNASQIAVGKMPACMFYYHHRDFVTKSDGSQELKCRKTGITQVWSNGGVEQIDEGLRSVLGPAINPSLTTGGVAPTFTGFGPIVVVVQIYTSSDNTSGVSGGTYRQGDISRFNGDIFTSAGSYTNFGGSATPLPSETIASTSRPSCQLGRFENGVDARRIVANDVDAISNTTVGPPLILTLDEIGDLATFNIGANFTLEKSIFKVAAMFGFSSAGAPSVNQLQIAAKNMAITGELWTGFIGMV